MNAKSSRLEVIRLIISSQEIANQDELVKELAKEGYNITQATLSRLCFAQFSPKLMNQCG